MTFENVTLILQTISPFAVLVTVYFLIKELKEQKKVAPANIRQNVAYLMKFIVMLRARENQYHQFNKGMLDRDQWNSVAISFNTLCREAKHLEILEFIKITFAYAFVEPVDAQVKQSKLSG